MHSAVREHAPLASPSLALEGLPPCFREGKISGSYQYLVNSHCVQSISFIHTSAYDIYAVRRGKPWAQ